MAAKIKSFFGRGSVQKQYDPDAVAIAQQLLASQEPPDAASQASRDGLEINIHTIDDFAVSRQLEALSIIPAQEDKIIRVYNDKGVVISEVPISGSPPKPVFWALAARVAISPVNSTRFITKRESMAIKNKTHADFLRMKIKMSREERRNYGDYLSQIENFACGCPSDSVDGQKMLALKTAGKSMRVRVNTNESFGESKR